MFYIYRLTCRHYCGKNSQNFYDGDMGYYSTIDKARYILRSTLGAGAIIDEDNDSGFEVWYANELSHIAYIISRVQVR